MSYTQRDGGWTFRLHETLNQHINHGANLIPHGDVVHRRLTDQQKRHIEGLYKTRGRTSFILESLETTFPGIIVVAKDIHNYIAKIRQKRLKGFTSTQAFIKNIIEAEHDGNPVFHAYELEDEDNQRLKQAF
ncbi:hypothetical protein F5Y13DRAFT_196040 [Hypoxylon sp. FL1857]|nr:hypothetical protein F5Y13DRAFT_196040 [Hypoxylon sp. FL1857]